MINFQNVAYESREFFLENFGNVLISTNLLNSNLFDESGKYISSEAILIDDQIFYFVEENEINLKLSILKKILIAQITQ